VLREGGVEGPEPEFLGVHRENKELAACKLIQTFWKIATADIM